MKTFNARSISLDLSLLKIKIIFFIFAILEKLKLFLKRMISLMLRLFLTAASINKLLFIFYLLKYLLSPFKSFVLLLNYIIAICAIVLKEVILWTGTSYYVWHIMKSLKSRSSFFLYSNIATLSVLMVAAARKGIWKLIFNIFYWLIMCLRYFLPLKNFLE